MGTFSAAAAVTLVFDFFEVLAVIGKGSGVELSEDDEMEGLFLVFFCGSTGTSLSLEESEDDSEDETSHDQYKSQGSESGVRTLGPALSFLRPSGFTCLSRCLLCCHFGRCYW